MTVQTLRPTANISTGGRTVTGAASLWQALADASDASYIDTTISFAEVAMDTFTLPAGAVVYRFRGCARVFKAATTNTSDTGIYLGANGGTVASSTWWTTGFGTPPQEPAGGTPIQPTTTPATYNGVWNNVALTQAQIDALTMMTAAEASSGGGTHLGRIADMWVEVVYVPAPTLAVSAPSGSVTTTLRPMVTWATTAGADSPTGQTGFRVKIFNATQYSDGGFTPDTSPSVWDTGDVTSNASSVQVGVNLPNGVSYRAYVQTRTTTNGVNQYSAWQFVSFAEAVPIAVPTGVTPANGGTISTSRPTLTGDVAPNAGLRYRREWQLATDSGFTTGLLTITEPTSALSTNPTGGFPFPTGSRLAQGVWYLRARSIDEFSNTSAYSATNTFTVAHVPSTTNRTPTGGSVLLFNGTLPITWVFSDPDIEDFQTKYRVQLWKTSDVVGSLQDSTLLTSPNQFHTFSGLNTTWKDTELRYKVLVVDRDGVSGAYSTEQTLFLRDAPTVTVTSPTNAQVIATAAPLITWTFSASAGRTQAQYRVTIRNVSTGIDVITSGWINGAGTSWQCPSPAVAVGPNYQAIVDVIDSAGLAGTFARNFTASYAQPAGPPYSVTSTQYPTEGYNLLDWSGATADGAFVNWRVYRRPTGGAWSKIYETTTSTQRTFRDYTAPSNTGVDYAVVQGILSGGFVIESAYVPTAVQQLLQKYMLTCPANPTLNMVLYSVNGESFEDEQEMGAIELIGRGRRMEYGTRWGTNGSLSVTFSDQSGGPTARAQRLALEALRDSGLPVYLLSPFGDVNRVALLSAKFTRVPGLGMHEMVTATIEYSEITV